ncbi:MAG: hypothetical protein K2P78_13775 [Gemmataceae bacterium]|nr:hypothetical protein [Gemmataceae bacterium]
MRFNDGSDVPEELLGEAVNEIVGQFGAVSFYKEAVEGRWRHADTLYRDDLALLVVDVPDTAKNRKWMKAYKARWKARLDQLELWVVSYPIDIE